MAHFGASGSRFCDSTQATKAKSCSVGGAGRGQWPGEQMQEYIELS